MDVPFYCFVYVYFAGYAMWPAVVLDESLASSCKGLKTFVGGRSVPVQFFGTHDFARFGILLKLREFYFSILSEKLSSFNTNRALPSFRVRVQQVKSFLSGLLTDLHSKCKKPSFIEGLEEAKR